MRTTSPRIFFATATAATALLLLLSLATGPTPSWPDSSEFGATSDYTTESFATPDRYSTMKETSAVWVSKTATPSIVANAPYNCIALNDIQGCPVGPPGRFTILPYFQTTGVNKTTSTPDGHTTTTTSSTGMSRGSRRRSTTNAISNAIKSDQSAAVTPRTMILHERFDGRSHEDTSSKSQWRRFRHEPLRLPDQFMVRVLNNLMYLAEVISADVISAFLFGRCRPRYYQRAKKNRLHRTRRRRYRRFMMNAADTVNMVWDACVQVHDTLCPMQDDVSRTTYQMVSNVQLIEYPATLSTFADVPTSEVVAIVASAGSSAIDSIASLSAPTLALPDLPIPASYGLQAEATTAKLRPTISTLATRLLGVPEMSDGASCHPRTSLLDNGLDTALRSAVSHRSPLPLEAAPPTTGPSLFLTAATTGCAVNDTIMTIVKDSGTERQWLASASTPGSPSTPKHRPTIVASGPNSGNAEGMVNSPVRYITAEQCVTTSVEEFGGPADDADNTPPAPFFVSERYTPESACYVSAHGVAYTTIIMSYVHRINFHTGPGAPDDTPTTTQTGDVSDILFPASNARLRCKWSRECIQTVSSEYYRSSVEAVFVARFIPDEMGMVVLTDLVTRHL